MIPSTAVLTLTVRCGPPLGSTVLSFPFPLTLHSWRLVFLWVHQSLRVGSPLNL